ncbi:MAG: hypothetical protein GOU99_02085 [Candidatus Altiarchaeota archaeon]|nr:hypothetical protein [Candidatus Altiarchaeota archaeon]
MVDITVSAKIMLTESESKLRMALENLFPEIRMERKGASLIGTGKTGSLEYLKRLVWIKRVLDTVRSQLIKNLENDSTYLFLNKQAAFARKLGICDKGSDILGEIELKITGNNLEKFIDLNFPMTEKGRPVLKNQSTQTFRFSSQSKP